MSKCRSCNREIDWVKTTRGKLMPVDPDYFNYSDLKLGDVIITDEGKVFTKLHIEDSPNVKGRFSHFSTCPDAKQWRSK